MTRTVTPAARRGATAALAILLVLSSGCGDDDAPPVLDGGDVADADAQRDGGPPRDWPLLEVPATTMVEPGVVRDVVRVPGFAPPPNPTTGAETPTDLDATQILRYREDADPPRPVRAIVIAMPGFLGGGGSFDALARHLVLLGAASGDSVEVWAIDRRANLLEDLRGMDAAEAASDPQIAHGYYFGGETVGGALFGGFRDPASVSYESEWGLRTHVEDLRRVIALVPEAERRGRVFLAGHSLGAAMTEAYAAWRFEDGTLGAEELAGIVLVDGALAATPIDEPEYTGGVMSGVPIAGRDAIRSAQPYTALPVLGVAVHPRSEVLALRLLLDPTGVVEDRGRDQLLGVLLGLAGVNVPNLTNRAALAVAYDDETCPVPFARVSLGDLTGGPTETYENVLAMGTLLRPSDPAGTYDWIDALEASPVELTGVALFAHSFVDGRSNFGEWYFPSRLSIDLPAVGGGAVPETGYQATEGLRAFDGPLMDAPVLAIASESWTTLDFDAVRARIASVVGAGRPAAGAARTTDAGFRVLDARHMSHLDPITASDSERNVVPQTIQAFIGQHASVGAILIPRM